MNDDWLTRLWSRSFRTDLATALGLAVLCLVPWPWDITRPHTVIVLLAVCAVALRRTSPTAALSLVWLMAFVQIGLNERPNLAAIAFVLVIYSASSVGNLVELSAAAASVLVGGTLASFYLARTGARFTELLYGSPGQTIVAVLAPPGVLGFAWLIGLAVRFFRSRLDESELRQHAETEADRARGAANEERLRNVMARDVHDIVGHSLAVIIAQADSVQFLDDTDRIRAVTTTIAETARRSLHEVREVLSGTASRGPAEEPQDLAALVEQVRAAGVVVEHAVRGERRPLDASRSVVVRRVVQEMLTNALRHGKPGVPIVFREIWRSGDLVLEVENAVLGGDSAGSGLGVEGMRSRLQAIGGFLEAEPVEGVFTARARVPLPAVDAKEAP